MSIGKSGFFVAAAVIAATACILYFTSRRQDGNTHDKSSERQPAPKFYGITVELRSGRNSCDTVSMGSMHEGERVVRKIRFVNRTDAPLILLDYRSSCRCTSIDLPGGAIAPEGYADAECMFDSRGEYGPQLNVVEIISSDDSVETVLLIDAEVK